MSGEDSGRSVIETPRLLIREQTSGDLGQLTGILSDPETMEFYPRPLTRAEVADWIARNLDLYARYGVGLWALIVKDTGEFIGQCGLWPKEVDGHHETEIGWHVKRARWRQGFASEAAVACRDHAFEVRGLSRLISLIQPENVPSQGVARKIGMSPWKEIEWRGLHHIVFSLEKENGRIMKANNG